MPRRDRLALAFLTDDLRAPDIGDILVLRATDASLATVLAPERLVFEQSFRPIHDALATAGLRVTERATAPAAMAIVHLTRSRTENLGNIARALALLDPGAVLAIDGAKTDGIDSLARLVSTHLPLTGQFTKAHGRTIWLTRPDPLPPVAADWAAAAAPAPNTAGFLTEAGLFSPDAPDAGSLALAAQFDGRIKGRVADLGAGWGWLAQAALARSPGITALALFEAEGRALAAAHHNVTDPRAVFHWADVRTLPRMTPPFDLVLMNPPFHQGRGAEPDLGAAFIATAARILKPSGRLLMVANRQLPYEAVLTEAFVKWERLSENGLYKVIAADRPRKP